eukprot:m51a1_g9794 hypothetical protein (629) ;mRNA; f:1763633-1765806
MLGLVPALALALAACGTRGALVGFGPSAGDATLQPGGDDIDYRVSLGFAFDYCGSSYTAANVDVNGYLSFADGRGSVYRNEASPWPGMVAWYWADWRTGASPVYAGRKTSEQDLQTVRSNIAAAGVALAPGVTLSAYAVTWCAPVGGGPSASLDSVADSLDRHNLTSWNIQGPTGSCQVVLVATSDGHSYIGITWADYTDRANSFWTRGTVGFGWAGGSWTIAYAQQIWPNLTTQGPVGGSGWLYEATSGGVVQVRPGAFCEWDSAAPESLVSVDGPRSGFRSLNQLVLSLATPLFADRNYSSVVAIGDTGDAACALPANSSGAADTWTGVATVAYTAAVAAADALVAAETRARVLFRVALLRHVALSVADARVWDSLGAHPVVTGFELEATGAGGVALRLRLLVGLQAPFVVSGLLVDARTFPSALGAVSLLSLAQMPSTAGHSWAEVTLGIAPAAGVGALSGAPLALALNVSCQSGTALCPAGPGATVGAALALSAGPWAPLVAGSASVEGLLLLFADAGLALPRAAFVAGDTHERCLLASSSARGRPREPIRRAIHSMGVVDMSPSRAASWFWSTTATGHAARTEPLATAPEGSDPLSARSSVVLPQPLEPTTAMRSPASTESGG